MDRYTLSKCGFCDCEMERDCEGEYVLFDEVLCETDAEDLLEQKMQEGWNIIIECKGKGREYEMTFEGTAHKVNAPIAERFYAKIHGVGNTIAELLKNMFKE